MKIKNLLFSLLCVLAISQSFISCSDNDDDLIDDGSTINLPRARVYILNEGSSNNDAGITFYAPNKDYETVKDIYKTQNKRGLGDTGQDMIEHDNNIYTILSGSSLLVKLNSACVEQGTALSFSAADGQPRSVVEQGGKLYVTLYSGKVAKINPKDMTIEGYVNVGKNPEGIAENDGFLYVVNSGWGDDSTMTVINTADFSVTKTIEVAKNPFMVLESDGEVFVIAYGEGYSTPILQKVDVEKETVTTITNASKMCEYNDIVYCVFTETDYVNLPSPWIKENKFFSYNTKTGTLKEENFLIDMPSELSKAVIYMLVVNPETGDFYVGTTDYETNGDVYRFDRTGKFVEKFESGGISPSKAVFF